MRDKNKTLWITLDGVGGWFHHIPRNWTVLTLIADTSPYYRFHTSIIFHTCPLEHWQLNGRNALVFRHRR